MSLSIPRVRIARRRIHERDSGSPLRALDHHILRLNDRFSRRCAPPREIPPCPRGSWRPEKCHLDLSRYILQIRYPLRKERYSITRQFSIPRVSLLNCGQSRQDGETSISRCSCIGQLSFDCEKYLCLTFLLWISNIMSINQHVIDILYNQNILYGLVLSSKSLKKYIANKNISQYHIFYRFRECVSLSMVDKTNFLRKKDSMKRRCAFMWYLKHYVMFKN